jgi:hypothetical protein
MTPVQVIVVLPDAASNKRVKGRPPEPAQQIPQKNGQWPLNQPLPDARRHLDAARREIASSRSEIARFLRSGAI